MNVQILAHELFDKNKTLHSQMMTDVNYMNLNAGDQRRVQRIVFNLIRQEYY